MSATISRLPQSPFGLNGGEQWPRAKVPNAELRNFAVFSNLPCLGILSLREHNTIPHPPGLARVQGTKG
jgi:hypothetical protein